MGQTNRIRKISPRILELENLEKIYLESNSIETPPPEIVYKGLGAVRDYFRQIELQGQDHLYEAKLLIVGEGGAGKTTLANEIINADYVLSDEETTRGIDVKRWQFTMPDGQPFRVNIWDFGGQEIYHATHQFFLTKRSLYLLVADTRKEDTDFYYWLNVVQLLSDNSPLLIVKNEKQDRTREINERALRGQFINLKEAIATNLATKRGLDSVIREIEHYIVNLSHVGALLPKTWVQVRETLERDSRNYIGIEEYFALCEKNGIVGHDRMLLLSGYLHDLGVFLHFQDDALLRKTVILKPKWGTDAVYKVLDNRKVIADYGNFDGGDLAHIWNESQYADMRDELLRLMINFRLAYKVPDSNSYIAPQLLTENQPDYKWDATDNLILRYTYEFMPKGILTRFIVVMHGLIHEQHLVWKSGVILDKDQTRAEVIEHYSKREIHIRVAGKHRKDLLTIVMYELDKIHASYHNLKYNKLIPCNCTICKSTQDPNFYPFETLRRFTEQLQDVIQCQKSFQMVNVRGLIDDVIGGKALGKESLKYRSSIMTQTKITEEQSKRPIEIFFSYSHKDVRLRDELEKHLSILKNQGVMASWYDRRIGVGKALDAEIKQHLNSAQIILLLISPDFMASTYINSIEIKRAMERHAAGEARVIPILLRRVDWKAAKFAELKMLPTDAKPVKSWSNLDDAFYDVEQGIREAVEEIGSYLA